MMVDLYNRVTETKGTTAIKSWAVVPDRVFSEGTITGPE